MSNSKRLYQLVNSAYVNNDVDSARTAYRDYILTQCPYSTKQRIYDAHTQTYRFIDVACGKCFHCQQSKINEWCTRMYAHAEDFMHVYFVTLTYRSFTNVQRSVNRLLLNKLQSAIWHLDSNNSTHRLTYSPCLLVKKHYQDFLKRLRKYSGLSDITYVISGEYGHDYGRPHFHMILFTNGELTKQDFIRAWSVALWQNADGSFVYRKNQKHNGIAFDFPIGRVDFHDLVSNGTFNTTAKIRVDGTYMNAANCFSYVCKYVCKRDKANLDRVRLAYNSLFHKEKYVKVFSNECQFKIISDYLRDLGYPFECIPNIVDNLNQYVYEKIIFEPRSVFCDSLSQFKQKHYLLNGSPASANVEFYPSVFVDFRNLFSPFCEFSRGCPIGSIYAKRNIQEFAQDIYTKPILQERGFVVPSYFRRKANDYLYGLRKMRKSIKGITYPLGGLVDLYRRFSSACQSPISLREYFRTDCGRVSFAQALRSPLWCFRDLYSGERIILAGGYARHYKYDRSKRDYLSTRNIPIADWIRYWTSSLQRELVRHESLTRQVTENLSLREKSLLLLTDLGFNIHDLNDSIISEFAELQTSKDLIYNELHCSAE